ncbi:homeobox protein PKNOX2-like [Cydia splendana]|uniref:homeobox protein PKNOX2-like n=1 Tax=Cydia splendana TaxID=1100963 RepID=UPI00300C59C7
MWAEVRVKQEPAGEVGARGEPAEQRVDQVHVKKEPEFKVEVSCEMEPWSELYADHVVKDELVLGPERPHRPDVGLVVRGANSNKSCSFISGSPPPKDEGDSKGRRGGRRPRPATQVMRAWQSRHPYPTVEEKRALAAQTGLTLVQVDKWFVNARYSIRLNRADKPGRNSNNSCSFVSGSPPPKDKGDSKGRRVGRRARPATQVMRAWLLQHRVHPYPTVEETRALAAQTGLTLVEVRNWFINARCRLRLNRADKPGTNSNNSCSFVSSSSPPKDEGDSIDKRCVLPRHATQVMRAWLVQHRVNPYPTVEEKRTLAAQTGLTLVQVKNWFINARRRILRPKLDCADKPDEPRPRHKAEKPYIKKILRLYV